MNNRFLKSVLVITGGTAFAQLLNILMSPIITRIYTPEEYGLVSIFGVIIATLAITTLKFEIGIPLTKSNRQATILILITLFLTLSFNIIVLLFILIFEEYLVILLGFENNDMLIYLIPLGIFLVSIFNISRQWTLKHSRYHAISKATMYQSLIGNSSKILFGLLGGGAFGFAISRIMAESMGFIVLSKNIWDNLKTTLKDITVKEILQTIKRFKDFALFQTPTSLLIIVGTHSPIIIIGIIYNAEISGFYALANTIIMLPILVIGNSIGDVFYSESARVIKKNPEKVLKLSRSIVIKLFIISVLPALILLMYGPEIFMLVFGEDWYTSGVYSQVLSMVLITRLIFHPLSKVYEIIERQKDKLYLNILQVLGIALVLMISLIYEIEPLEFIFLYSVIISVMNIIIYIWSQYILIMYIKGSSKN